MIIFIILVFCTIPTFTLTQTQEQDFDVAKKLVTSGNSKGALACATCHQENGAGNAAAGFPQLAGMNAAYFASMPPIKNSAAKTSL